MDQENVVFLYNGIFFSHKEELNFVICKYMDRIGEHHLKRGYLVQKVNIDLLVCGI
jgi:hypothetical protein